MLSFLEGPPANHVGQQINPAQSILFGQVCATDNQLANSLADWSGAVRTFELRTPRSTWQTLAI
jgi:hypothetical protein